jgi:hypothetical protein
VTTESQPATGVHSTARVFSIVGLILALVALLFLPIICGPVGAALGFIGMARGDRRFGRVVGILGIITTIVGMTLGYLVFKNMHH